jgi:aminoglycoside phosphotransferase family enzyme/predicted kinase
MSRPESDTDEFAVSAFLSDPATHPDCSSEIEIVETHASRVFLAGRLAYKVKKHVTFSFLDFSNVARRRRALERELELNQPHAPEIYREVLPIHRLSDGSLGFEGKGPIIDYALVMARFEQQALLSRIAEGGALDAGLSSDLADMVARYHVSAPIIADAASVTAFRGTIDNLVGDVASFEHVASVESAARTRGAISKACDAAMPLMTERALSGLVRRCHGDLHLNNIVLLSGRPVPFDALEFDERLGIIDVLYDLAFLLMDLDFRGDRRAANRVLNRYVGAAPIGDEIPGLALLPLFLSTRALVRAVVQGQRRRQLSGDALSDAEWALARYLGLADSYLRPPRACLVAVGGLSGTGKSTLASGLAPSIGAAPGALHLRSDVERKRLFGVPDTTRLGPDAYTARASERVYRRVFEKVRAGLAAGHSVVVDMVAAKVAERQKIAAIAAEADCAFVGLWLEAPLSVLVARVDARRGDASDADAAVVAQQAEYDLGDISWVRVDARGSAADTLNVAKAKLQQAGIEPVEGSPRC